MQQRLNAFDPSVGDKGSYSLTPMSLGYFSVPRLAFHKVEAGSSQPLDFWVPRLQGMFEPLGVLHSGVN